MVYEKAFTEEDHKVFRQLMDYLHRGGQYGYYWRKNGKKSVWWHTASPEPLPIGETDCYFNIYPSNVKNGEHERNKLEEIIAMNCLFADIDGKNFDGGVEEAYSYVQSLIQPSVIIFTGHGFHLYWLLSETISLSDENRDYYRLMLYRWMDYVKGDPRAKDLARVLRIPGTWNGKEVDHKCLVTILKADLTLTYPVESLFALMPPPKETDHKRQTRKSTGSGIIESKLGLRLIRRDKTKAIDDLIDATKKVGKGQKVLKGEIDGRGQFYASRSEAEAGIMSNLVLFGWTKEEIFRGFQKCLPGHYKDLDPRERETYLELTYNNVVTDILNSPERRSILETYCKLSLAMSPETTWLTKQSISLALLAKAFQFKMWQIGVSYREIEEYTGLSMGTITAWIKKLVEANYITIVGTRKGNKANTYDLFNLIQIAQELNSSHQGAMTSTDYCSLFEQKTETWEVGGLWSSRYRLGGSARAMYQALSDEVQTEQALASRIQRSSKTAQAVLRKLKSFGLARKNAEGWVLGERKLVDLARELGCGEQNDFLRKYHQAERDGKIMGRWKNEHKRK